MLLVICLREIVLPVKPLRYYFFHLPNSLTVLTVQREPNFLIFTLLLGKALAGVKEILIQIWSNWGFFS